MGKYKKARATPIKENPNATRQGKLACQDEVTDFFDCMKRANFDIDTKCARESANLMSCAEAAARKPKATSTMNYHLQRLSRMLRRG